MGNQNSKHMASSPSLRPYLSTDSEFSDPGCSSQHTSSRPEVDEKIADRRRRNGESAKRSRQKRKLRLEEMESSYQRLVSGQAQLVEENKKLRELIASLGGDASAISPTSLSTSVSQTPGSLSTSNTAKRTKRECRVDLKANSLESAVGAHTPPIGLSNHCTTLDIAVHNQLNDSSRSELTGSCSMTSTSAESIPQTSLKCASKSQTQSNLLTAQKSLPTALATLTSISRNLCLTRQQIQPGTSLVADSTNVLT